MKELVYLSINMQHADGIYRKIQKQIQQFEEAGLKTELRMNSNRNLLTLYRHLIPFFSKQYYNTDIDWAKKDVVYLRHGPVVDQSMIHLLKKIKKENPKILTVLEVATYPYIHEYPFYMRVLIQSKEFFTLSKLKKYVDRIVTYTDDEEIFDIPCINIHNSYEFPKALEVSEDKSKDKLSMIAAASLMPYHGYDRLLMGMANYYRYPENKRKLHFTLIGEGKVLDSYKEIVKKYNLSDYVEFTGRKAKEELSFYYKKADLAIGSLGFSRIKLLKASPLKTKEYMAYGLPFIYAYTDDQAIEESDYFMKFTRDESPIDILELLKFYDGLLLEKTKVELSNEIFEFAKKTFDFKIAYQPVVSYIMENEK
ncbi:MAG: glycosyltransferase [Lactovum sp.]